MTSLARQFAVLPLELEAGLRQMVERPAVHANQREGSPVMFHMTTGTVGLIGRTLVGAPVKARARLHAALNLGVTLQALETPAAGAEIVTGSAFGDTLQLLVRPR